MDTIVVTFENGEKKEYRKGIKFCEVVADIKDKYKHDIIYGQYRNENIGYEDTLVKNGKLCLYDINTKQGNKVYERGLIFLFLVCAYDVLGDDSKIKIRHSIDKGIFCEVHGKLNEENVKKIKDLMLEKVKKGIPFVKIETSRLEALQYFREKKREDKAKTLFYDTSSYVTLYKFDGIYNYVLGDLPYDTSCLKYFDLTLLEEKGIVLRFPSIYDDGKVVKYTHHEKYFNSLENYSHWGEILNINNLGELNEAVSTNHAGEIVNLSEIIQDYKLLSIAESICLNKDTIKIILLSGPSSSGKTTTAKKLSLYLKTLGLKPHHLSIDDYFLDRKDTPLDEFGKPDFESLRAIDRKLFNSQIAKLLKGFKVVTPTFDFVEGKKKYTREIQMGDNDILVIEGLHALNNQLLDEIPRKHKYKIYVSPLTFLNVDNDNRISMTDIRLLRRIVRDNRTRGYSPSHTLNGWADVRRGEEKYVFPYQDEADVIFNSSLAYELGVLKTYVEPLLYTIKEDDPEYQTAHRLIELFKFILPFPSDDVPKLSILREFIGGSFFER